MKRTYNFMKGKKGMEMAIGTIVVIILGLVILSSSLYMFIKGKQTFLDTTESILEDSNVDLLIKECNREIEITNFYDYCCMDKTFRLSSSEERELTCDEARLEVWTGERIKESNCEGVCAD